MLSISVGYPPHLFFYSLDDIRLSIGNPAVQSQLSVDSSGETKVLSASPRTTRKIAGCIEYNLADTLGTPRSNLYERHLAQSLGRSSRADRSCAGRHNSRRARSRNSPHLH